MKQKPAESIVAFLSFSGDHCDSVEAIARFNARKWERVLQWLDDSGLAFYFLQKLKDTKTTDAVPASALCRLEENFASNRCRMEDLARRFAAINNSFETAGTRYSVIKGFSLIPQFCPYSVLRHQGDLDYLLDDESFPAARQALTDVGYVFKDSPSDQVDVFVIPGGTPSRTGEQYSPRAPHAVELHTDVWETDLNRLPGIPKLFYVERSVTHHWNGLSFPAQKDEDAFLLQVLHACNHLFTLWIRMSCLFEIGYFLNRRAGDDELWDRIEQRVGDSRILREFVVIITELVSKLFESPIPRVVQAWGATIHPGSRVWIEHYARRCVFSELPAYQFSSFPTAKFVLFLHEQFRGHAAVGKDLVRKRLLPETRLSRMASSVKKNPSLVFNVAWWRHHLVLRRTIFHILAGLHYLVEVPRWRWLNRTKLRTGAT